MREINGPSSHWSTNVYFLQEQMTTLGFLFASELKLAKFGNSILGHDKLLSKRQHVESSITLQTLNSLSEWQSSRVKYTTGEWVLNVGLVKRMLGSSLG